MSAVAAVATLSALSPLALPCSPSQSSLQLNGLRIVGMK